MLKISTLQQTLVTERERVTTMSSRFDVKVSELEAENERLQKKLLEQETECSRLCADVGVFCHFTVFVCASVTLCLFL